MVVSLLPLEALHGGAVGADGQQLSGEDDGSEDQEEEALEAEQEQ